jgi:hypothetical protein
MAGNNDDTADVVDIADSVVVAERGDSNCKSPGAADDIDSSGSSGSIGDLISPETH